MTRLHWIPLIGLILGLVGVVIMAILDPEPDIGYAIAAALLAIAWILVAWYIDYREDRRSTKTVMIVPQWKEGHYPIGYLVVGSDGCIYKRVEPSSLKGTRYVAVGAPTDLDGPPIWERYHASQKETDNE